MDPDEVRPTPGLFVNENETPAVEGPDQKPAAQAEPVPTVEQEEEVIDLESSDEQPAPQARPQHAPEIYDVDAITLRSLNVRVDEKEIWPTLRKGLAKTYFDASEIIVGKKGGPEHNLKHELKEKRTAINGVSKKDFRERAPKQWKKLLDRAKRMLQGHCDEHEKLPETAKTALEKRSMDAIVKQRAQRLELMEECIQRADAVVADFEYHLA
ncbi:hypothetical protein LTR86_001421 [Recurvomyces mirabilis]|nr:hypothetical protein LTR86_001421 [Recurvomyces mirabilis]